MKLTGKILTEFVALRLKGAPEPSLLENALARLGKQVDLHALAQALWTAKAKKIQANVNAFSIDNRREWEAARMAALAGLQAAARFLRPLSSADNPDTEKLDQWIKTVKSLRYPPGPERRKRAGRNFQPWISETRQALKKLGVPKDLADDLLIALGLKPVA